MYTNAYLNRFRGTRNYVQGADMVNGVLEYVKSQKGENGEVIAVKFRSFTENSVYLSEDVCDSPEYSLIGTFSLRDETLISGYFYSGNTKIATRVDYDESIFAYDVDVDKQTVSSVDQKYSVIEDLVAVVKFLHNQLFPSGDEKWVFVQLDLDVVLPRNYRRLEARIGKMLRGSFTVTEFSIDGAVVGKIGFSKVKI